MLRHCIEWVSIAAGNLLEVSSDIATVALALAALAAFLSTQLVFLKLLLAHLYATEIASATASGREMHLQERFKESVAARLAGATWTVAHEYQAVSQGLAFDVEPIPWRTTSLLDLARGYESAAARIRRSLPIRLRSPQLISSEAGLAGDVQRALLTDADFVISEYSTNSALAEWLDGYGTRLLVAPPGRRESYDTVRCTLQDGDFGVPTLSFAALAEKDWEHKSCWGSAPNTVSAALDERVREIARRRMATPSIDFNGRMARLRGWRVERSQTSRAHRIHLLVEGTNFASVLATTGGFHEPPWDRLDPDTIRAASLACQPPADSWTANALSVHLAVITADRYLLLVQRSPHLEWAPGLLNTAVNGVAELSAPGSVRDGDEDAFGFVDLSRTALREADEEVGPHLQLDRNALVVRALALDNRPDQITPYVIFETRTRATFAETTKGHFAAACRHEGAFEIGEHMVGLPLVPEHAGATVAWLKGQWDSGKLSASGLATTMLSWAHLIPEEELIEMWHETSPASEPDPAIKVAAI